MKKRLFSILMALALFLSLLPVTALAADGLSYDDNGFSTAGDSVTYQPATLTTDKYDLNNDGTMDEVYEIANAGQLYWFAGLVNGDASVCVGDVTKNTAANAVLTADITINENVLNADGTLADNPSSFKVWTPIGSAQMDSVNVPTNTENAYAGTFDGQGHTISGLYFNDGEKTQCGLFGVIKSGASVSKVTVSGSYIYGKEIVGGVCGYNYLGIITNCANSGTISGREKLSGGVCGHNEKGTVTACTNSGIISGSQYIGGVCGYNADTMTNCTNSGTVSGTYRYTGGVCGFNASTGKIENCRNEGTVIGTTYTGGVSGYNNSKDGNTGTITGCTNSGTVTGTDRYTGGVCGQNGGAITGCTNSGTVNGTSNTGGVCGYNVASGKIENCRNEGTVGGKHYTGGVSGYSYGTITGCTNSGPVTGNRSDTDTNYGTTGGVCGFNGKTITGCTNSGKVNGTGNTGGVCGYNYRGTITGCTNYGTVTGTSYTGGVCGDNGGTITGCINYNTVDGTQETGGVSGYSNGTIKNSLNTGNVSGTSEVGGVCGYLGYYSSITYCANFGTVTGTGDNIGGVCGQNYNGTISNCYFNSDAYSGNAVGKNGGNITDVTKKDADQFASGEVAWLLNGSTSEETPVWRQNLDNGNTQDEYPLPVGTEADSTGIVYQVQEKLCSSETGKTIYSNSSQDKLLHTLEDVAEVPATYEHDGVKAHQHCSVCEKNFINGVEQSAEDLRIPKLVMPIIPVTPTYPPVVTQPAEGGAVTVWPQAPAQGVTVTITPKPEDGYEVGSVTVTDRSGNALEVTDNGDGTYSFTQPAGAVTVDVQFKETVCDGGADCSSHGFDDVNTNLWYHEAIDYVVENGIMNGVGDGKFDPNGSLSRSMLMTMLARLDGVDTDGGANWYEKGLNWAVETGISDGTNPDGDISRQEVATMLYRYARLKGYDTSARADLSAFTDGDQTASWAEDAMEWAVANGIFQGDDNYVLNPKGSATRAEIAQIFMNFMENIIK